MVDRVRRLISAISFDAVKELFANADLKIPSVETASHRADIRALVDAVERASDAARNRVESVANDVVTFSEKTVYADIALRSAVADDPALVAILDADTGLAERSLLVLLKSPKRFARARNIASGMNYRGGRYHRGYVIRAPAALAESLSDAVHQISNAIQKRQGGRRVQQDEFTFTIPGEPGQDGVIDERLVHHIAVYIEAPAIAANEFLRESDEVAQVVRRPAKELAIDYEPATGRLDIAGYGLGGGAVLEAVAELFRKHAVADAAMTELQKRETRLQRFVKKMEKPPAPPGGVRAVHIKEIRIRSGTDKPGQASFLGGTDQSAYERMAELKVGLDDLSAEFVRSVTFEFVVAARSDDDPERIVRATLTWPNSLTWDNASVGERRVFEAYLVNAGYIDPEPDPDGAST